MNPRAIIGFLEDFGRIGYGLLLYLSELFKRRLTRTRKVYHVLAYTVYAVNPKPSTKNLTYNSSARHKMNIDENSNFKLKQRATFSQSQLDMPLFAIALRTRAAFY